MYTLQDGVALAQAMDPEVRKYNYCTALGGSVLHKGESLKDIDILLLPIEDDVPNDEERLLLYLTKVFTVKPALREREDKYGPSVTRTIYKGETISGKKVDFFIYKRL